MAFHASYKSLPKDARVTPVLAGRLGQDGQDSEDFGRETTSASKLSSCTWVVNENSCDTRIALQCAPPENLRALNFCYSSKGLKRKRPSTETVCRRDLSSLSLENDSGLILGLGVTISPSDSGISAGSATSSGSMLMKDMEEEEGSPMELGLGVTRPAAHDLWNGCVTSVTSGCGSALTSMDSGVGTFLDDRNPGVRADVLLGLGRLQCSVGGDKDDGGTREGFGSASCISSENDLGMHLQLGLSANFAAIVESNRVSGVPFGTGYGSAYQDSRSEHICNEQIPVVDEGSTSARSIKSGGYIPSLLMGRRFDSVACINEQTLEGRLPANNGMSGMGFTRDDDAFEADLSMNVVASTGTTSTSGASGGPTERPHKTCKFRGCGKGARGASGLCIAHGGGRRCQKQGCNKGAEGRTVYCKAHGGGPRCQSLGCTKSAEGKTDYCISHGGGRRCSEDGCSKAARGRSGLCIRHGGGKRCQWEGCTKSAEGYSGLCISHGGGRRCQFPSCGKGAQGSTMFCKAHGGGKRCMIQGCNKGAEGRTPLCKGHGGGKRCMFDGGGVCTKSVHGGTSYCVAHGGGKRCTVQGCTKSARGKTEFCVRHGGGKRCKVENCTKSAQGSTDFCKAHGGGKRCSWGQEGCLYSAAVFQDKTGDPLRGPCDKFARGKIGLCAAHIALVQDQRVHGAGTIGNALPSGIGPGLFHGLVSGSTHKVPTVQSGSDASKQSNNAGDDCADHSSDCGGSDSFMQACTSYGSSRREQAGMEDETCQSQKTSHLSLGRSGYAHNLRPAEWNLDASKLDNRCLNEVNAVVASSNHAISSFGPPAQHTQDHVAAAKLYFPYFIHVQPPPQISGMRGKMSKAGSVPYRPFIPPQVLVPLSMQRGELLPSQEKEKNKHTGDDGIFNMSSLSLFDERVHGGNILTVLSDEARSSGSTESESGLRSSQGMVQVCQEENERRRQHHTLHQRGPGLDQSCSLGDVGRFLATGVDGDRTIQ